MVGVQAQLSTAGLALRARTESLTAARVDRARLTDRSIVLTWAMRGTLHLVAAEDFGWLTDLIVASNPGSSNRRLREMGVGPDQTTAGVRAIERMLDREGPMTRAEIGERLRRRGLPTEGQILPHLLWLAAARASVCFGPDRDGQRTHVLVRDWLEAPRRMDRDSALAELAVRYLRSHAPATPTDLSSWSGVRVSDAKRGWRAIEDRLVEVATVRGPMWMLGNREPEVPPGLVRLLPSFDEFLLGWKDRSPVARPDHWRKIHPGAGWYHPAALVDGRGVGTWKADRGPDVTRIEVRPFTRLSPAVWRGLQAEADALSRYLGEATGLTVSPHV
ncbi:MAG TPA: winged helix DNA-binding domain-containing protein [Actinomycetota bacterium]|nr:winged helix DNA-binding domain-containing protein [Actinomycetota bacterium]